ncbi:MAG: glycosyltransferase family 4 protein [Candidatus Methanoperedens sp.]
MRIAYFAFDQFIPSKHAGFVHTFSIVRSLQEIGHDITLYALPAPPKLYNLLSWSDTYQNIKVKYVRFTVSFRPGVVAFIPLNLPSFINAWKCLSDQKPELIHERFHTPNPFGRYLAEKVHIPRILEVNSLYIEDGAYKNRLTVKLATIDRSKQFENADAIITQTGSLKKIILTLTDKPVYVVPNGVNTELFRPDAPSSIRQDLNLKPEDIIVTFLGSFREWHGVHRIPEIASEIKKRHSNVKFVLIGSGPLFAQVNSIKTDNMFLTGPVEYEKIPGLLASSDILIAPFDNSRFDYFEKYGFWWNPVKLFEYASAGRPVVSYDYPEIRNIAGECGLLAEPGNMNDFIDKLSTLIENSRLRIELGKKGRAIAVREYDWKVRALQTENVYKQVLKY